MNETDEFTAKIRLSMKLFIKNLDRWRNNIKLNKLGDLLQMVLEESEYTDMLLKDKSIEAPGRLENLKELVNAINEFDSLSNFLEHIQLVMDGGANANVESVKIMTLHAAKGLEFSTVFLPGWEEGIFPNQKSLDENGKIGLEEERRLAYVGITRAKTNVWIFNASARLMHGQWIDSIPSRFIDEIPKKYVTKVSSFADVIPEYKSGLASKWISSMSKKNSQSIDKIIGISSSSPNLNIVNDKKLYEGERIFHQKFGYGTILNIDGEKVEIKFEKSDTKKVLMSFIEKTN
jgi:DNA helicase-2/ATP-dependent DNA helicase PcrA